MKALVIGFGSIGSRHARILAEIGCDVAVVSKRQVDFPKLYGSVRGALEDFKPDYVVIANRTSEHIVSLRDLKNAGFKGLVLVEKPLFRGTEDLDVSCFKKVLVGYNMRFHPLIRRLRAELMGQTVFTVQACVGKDIRTWRPGTDYRACYSAFVDAGGGALRDLSHELDYALWLLGGWRCVTAVGGHVSKLEIETDDVFSVLLRTGLCNNVFVHMNYVDPVGRRTVLVITAEKTIELDLLRGTIAINNNKEDCPADRDLTYREMHKAILRNDWSEVCSYAEGCEVMRLIEIAEQASSKGVWVKR